MRRRFFCVAFSRCAWSAYLLFFFVAAQEERWFQQYAGRGEANAAFAPPRLVFRLPCGKDFALLSGCAFRRRERGRLWVRLNVGTAMELER